MIKLFLDEINWERMKIIVEPSSATALAAVIAEKDPSPALDWDYSLWRKC
jgi:threonine dehydratase